MNKRSILAVACMFAISVFAAGCVTVVPIGHESDFTGEKQFNAAADVENIWADKALPDLKENAVDLAQLLTAAHGNLEAEDVAQEFHGHYSMGDRGAVSYIVHGEGVVTNVDRSKKVGTMTVKLAGYDGPVTVKLQIGPVYRGSAIRDTISFIKYEDYKNQVDWAKVSQAFHQMLDKDVIAQANPESLQGKTISFYGAFTVDGNQEILIMPIEIQTK